MNAALAVPASTEISTLSVADEIEMEQIRVELYEALQHIEDLPARYPDS